MNIIGLFIATCLVLLGVVHKRTDTPRVLSSHDEPLITGTATPTPTSTLTPTSTPTKAPTPTPTPLSDNTVYTDTAFRFPNSKVIHERQGKLELESSDNVVTITDWYKQLIERQHMNTKTFVQTKANGKVNNKLVANSAKEEWEITIQQESDDAKVIIVINHTDK